MLNQFRERSGPGPAEIIAVALSLAVVLASFSQLHGPVKYIASALPLIGMLLVLSNTIAGLTLTLIGAAILTLASGSTLSGLLASATAVTLVLVAEVPAVSRQALQRFLVVAGLFTLYPIIIYAALILTSGTVAGRTGIVLSSPSGRGVLTVFLAVYMSLVAWSVIAPGRGIPRIRGLLRLMRKRIDIILLIPTMVLVVPSIRVQPVSLILIVVGAAGYIWTRFLGGGRLAGVLVFTLTYYALLALFGITETIDKILSG